MQLDQEKDKYLWEIRYVPMEEERNLSVRRSNFVHITVTGSHVPFEGGDFFFWLPMSSTTQMKSASNYHQASGNVHLSA